MKLLLERIANVNKGSRKYCIGHLYYFNNKGEQTYLCDTIEDIDRGLDQAKPETWKLKQKSITAIPIGTYKVTTKIVSGTFSQKAYYKKHPCLGRVPRLLDVPAYSGILMHCGTNETSSAGCLILGYNKVVGKVVNSQEAYEKLTKLLGYGTDGHEITITRKYSV